MLHYKKRYDSTISKKRGSQSLERERAMSNSDPQGCIYAEKHLSPNNIEMSRPYPTEFDRKWRGGHPDQGFEGVHAKDSSFNFIIVCVPGKSNIR